MCKQIRAARMSNPMRQKCWMKGITCPQPRCALAAQKHKCGAKMGVSSQKVMPIFISDLRLRLRWLIRLIHCPFPLRERLTNFLRRIVRARHIRCVRRCEGSPRFSAFRYLSILRYYGIKRWDCFRLRIQPCKDLQSKLPVHGRAFVVEGRPLLPFRPHL